MQICPELVTRHQPEHSVRQAGCQAAQAREEMRNEPLNIIHVSFDQVLTSTIFEFYHDCVKENHGGIDQYFQDFIVLDNLSVALVDFLGILVENFVNTLLQLRSLLLFKMILRIIVMIFSICRLRF